MVRTLAPDMVCIACSSPGVANFFVNAFLSCKTWFISTMGWLPFPFACEAIINLTLLFIYCELAERSSIREARELLLNVWGLGQGVSQKLSIFDI